MNLSLLFLNKTDYFMPNKDSFLTIQPKNSILKKHISYYYFHQSTELNFKKSFVFFPNYIHGLTVYKNSSVGITEKGSFIQPTTSNEMTVLYTMNYTKNIKVDLNGIFNKVGVAFQVAGLNHFISENLCDLYDEKTHQFNHFGQEFEEVLSQVFSSEILEEKRDLLDQFFSTKLTNFENKQLINCIENIIKSNGTFKVEELAEKAGIHRKTLLRLFQKHFCCSIEEYKKMVKFRNTLNYTQSQENFNSLTEISLYNHYYDQADFNKQFKAITKYTPKQFLSKIKKMGNEETYWVIE